MASMVVRNLMLMAAFLLAAGHACARADPTPKETVDALNRVFGPQNQSRANHANGLVLTGSFRPDPGAALVSKAIHFQPAQAPVKVTVRFSNFGGNSHIADAHAGAAPYGMAVKFGLQGGAETDIVMHSFNGFPSRTTSEFRDFLVAMGNSRTALQQYAATHERAKLFLEAVKPAPASFASQPYFGVNSFKFINASGAVSVGRYRFVPEEAASYLDEGSRAAAPHDYLRREIRQRLLRAPVVMKLLLQMAEQGDALDDPSVAWPEQRRLISLGTLTIQAVASDSQSAEQSLSFFPDDLPDGIEVQDPMLTDRTKAYAESIGRRQR